MSKRNIIGLFVAAAVLSSSFAYAQMGNGGNFTSGKTLQEGSDLSSKKEHKKWRHERRGHFKGKVLNLNDDQQKQLREIRERQHEGMKSSWRKMKDNRQAFNDELVKANPDMNKVNGLQSELKGIHSQMADDQLNATLETKKIMSHEQFAGYMALERAEHMKGRHHKGWGKHDKSKHRSKCGNCKDRK